MICWMATTGRACRGMLVCDQCSASAPFAGSCAVPCQQVFSLGTDHVIKIWDLRNNGCLQTISPVGDAFVAHRTRRSPLAAVERLHCSE